MQNSHAEEHKVVPQLYHPNARSRVVLRDPASVTFARLQYHNPGGINLDSSSEEIITYYLGN